LQVCTYVPHVCRLLLMRIRHEVTVRQGELKVKVVGESLVYFYRNTLTYPQHGRLAGRPVSV